jgi:hypothetical protein
MNVVLFNTLTSEEDRKGKTETRFCKYWCRGKETFIKYCEFQTFCLVQPKRRVGCIILSLVGRVAAPHVCSILSHKRHDFQNNIEHKTYLNISKHFK